MTSKKKEKKERRNPVGRFFAGFGKVLGTILLVGLLTGLIFACLFAVYVKNDLSEQAEMTIEGFDLDQTSVMYYEDPTSGEDVVLCKLYGGSNRTWVRYEDIPENLVHACIAIEDKRFEEHQGVDWLTTMKACVKMFLGTGEAGGSTITQQLIKNLTGDQQITVRRKIVEIYRALEFEKTHTKEEILEMYLNIIALGENCSGVQSAAKVYFGKNVEDLTLAECASLIGITNNPSMYDPYINPENNKERQEIILSEMLKQGYITQAEHDEAVAQELVFVNGSDESDEDDTDFYTYFEDQVIRDVCNDLCAKTGYDYDIAYKMLLTGGYQIYSTMNPDVQAAVDEIYQNLDNIPNTTSSQQLQSGIVIIDNNTGDVVALSGGVGEKDGSLTWNRATQSLLSPGSTIKPISVYAPALELGLITPATVYDDTPYSFTNGAWPKNTNYTYRGLTSINDAVCSSINTVAVKVLADVTPEYSFTFAKDNMGLSTLTSEYVSSTGQTLSDVNLAPLALGGLTNGVTVRAMANAYATFANQGIYRSARTYTKVTDSNGNIILDNTQETHVAMKELTAWYITDMLENTVQTGTGYAARLGDMAVAGKTGTTTSDFDRWFAGYTPYYTGVVWCGYDDPEEVVLSDSSTNPSIVLWKSVMELVHENLSEAQFSQPEEIVTCQVCYDSGLLATDACNDDPRGSRVRTVKLSKYDVPTSYCSVHQYVDVCDGSGQLANEYCPQVPDNTISQAALLDISRLFPMGGISVTDQAYTIPLETIPENYYTPTTSDTAFNTVCTLHTEEDVPSEDEETEDGEDGENPDGETDETVPADNSAPAPNEALNP